MIKALETLAEKEQKKQEMLNELAGLEKRFVDDVVSLAKKYGDSAAGLLTSVAHTMFDMLIVNDMDRYDPESGKLCPRGMDEEMGDS